jgi:hypothetical protein
MKRTNLSLAIVGLLLALLSWTAQAQPNPNPPGQISYQGFLTDANGIPLATNAPRNYTIIFRIWDSSSGGNNVWAEQQIVTVDRGYFTVMLGSGTGVSPNFTNNLSGIFSGSSASDRYIGITVNDISGSEIAPRLRLLATPYSLLAGKAMSVAAGGTVPDNALSGNVALRAGGNTFTGLQYFTNGQSGSLFLDNMTEIWAKDTNGAYDGFLWPRWNDNATYLNYGPGGFSIRNNSSVQAMFIEDGRSVDFATRVGIGTTLPAFPLSFPNTLGDKISLYPSATPNNSFGFGIQGNQLQIHTAEPASDVVFGSGSSANLSETMRIKGNGNVGIGTSTPNNALQIGNLYSSAVGYGLAIASPQYGANIQINSTSGGCLLLDDLSDGGANTDMLLVRNTASLAHTFTIQANGNCTAASFNSTSDRNIKENFQTVSPQEVLTKVVSLPIQKWNFKSETATTHIGPMAQDFYAAFGVGPDDKHIATVDADGVALAAIQGLNQKLEQKENEINELKQRLGKLEALISHKPTTEER